MKRAWGDSALILTVFLAAWVLVNVPILRSPLGGYPVVDARWHHLWATQVSRGDITVYAPYFRAPLYPWLLGAWYALTGNGTAAGALFSMTAGAVSAVLLHRTALDALSRGTAFLTAALWSLWGTWLVYSGFMLIEPLYVLLLLASFHALCRRPVTPASWFLLGLAAIARPGAALLLPASLYLFRPRARSWLAWCIPVAAVWAVNAFTGDPGTIISSQGGINFYIGSGPEADGVTAFAPPGGRVPPGELPYVDNVWASSLGPLPEGASPSSVSSSWTLKTLRHIASRPLDTLRLLAAKIMFMLSPVEIPCNYDVYYMRRLSPFAGLLVTGPPAPLPGMVIWLLLPGAVLAGRLLENEKRALAWMMVLAAGLMPFFMTARFRLPMVPFALLLLVPRFLRKPRRALLASPLGVAIGMGLAALSWPSVERSGVNMPFHDGMAHYSSGSRAAARALFMIAWERASSRTDGMDLNGTDALYNLGVMALEDREWAEAEFWFGKALEWNPSHEPSRIALVGLTGMPH